MQSRKSAHLELGAVACAQLLVELMVERRLAGEEVDRSRAVSGEGGAGGDGGLGVLGLEELLHHPDLRGEIERQRCANPGQCQPSEFESVL